LILMPFFSGAAFAKESAPSKLKILFIDELKLRDEKTESWGQYSLNGLRLGLKGKTNVEVVSVNVYRSPVLAYEAVQKYAKDVDLVMGLRTSAQALMAKKAADQFHLPFISIMATSDSLLSSDKSKSSVMMAARNRFQVEGLANELWTQKKKSFVGIITTKNCVYCVEMTELVKKDLDKRNIPYKVIGQSLSQEPISQSLFDGTEKMSHIGLFVDEAGGMAAVAALKRRNYKGTVFGGDSWSINNIATESREAYTGICLVNAVTHSESQVGSEFSKRYKSEFNRLPTNLALLGYDSGLVLSELVSKCKNERDDLRECFAKKISKVKIRGTTGLITFEEDGGRSKDSLKIEKYGCK
ncbi:ABC transporter substrate-binding protein, partial [Oligoflexaceae bacterium]|nr:ABC transporter substrate-binding protein [Oligoflexaceae bacterium]